MHFDVIDISVAFLVDQNVPTVFLSLLWNSFSATNIARPWESRPTEKLKVDFRSVPYNRPETVCEAICA